MTEFMKGVTDRRTFLKRLAAVGGATIIGSSADMFSRPMKAWALPGDGDDTVLVSVFLRGGADGLNMVVPYGDDGYYTVRPTLGIQAGSYIDLDGFFGLEESLRPLHRHFLDGVLSVVHAAGSTDPTRSHFAAQPNMDTGFNSNGWLQRALQTGGFDQIESGLSIGGRVSPPLQGPWAGTVVRTINQTVQNGMSLEIARPAIEEMYAASRFTLDRTTVENALLSVDQVSMVTPGDPSVYPSTGLSTSFREASALIKADIGVRGVAIDYGGWDTHSNQTTRMQTLGTTLAGALNAFQDDLGSSANRVVTVIMTEFGRTARENGSFGTDHGHGNLMMVMGQPLRRAGGGQVHVREWPGLNPDQLNEDRDLKITTDFRSVLAELVDRHLGVSPSAVFPGYTPNYVGLLAALLLGDTDQSGAIDQSDAGLIVNDLAGNPAAGYFPSAGDLDGDGDTDLLDALLLAQEIAGQ